MDEWEFAFLFLGTFLLLADPGPLSQVGCRFGLGPDGPDKTQQFAPYRGDDLAFVFSCRRQPGVSLAEPDLRFPGNLLDRRRNLLLAFA